MKRLVIRLVLIMACMGFFGARVSAPLFAQEVKGKRAPLYNAQNPNKIPDRYIVVFKDDVPAEMSARQADRVERELGAVIHYRYSSVLNGFSATLTRKALRQLRRDPQVAYVEASIATQLDDPIEESAPIEIPETDQTNATWGIDRIDQRDLPLNAKYTYNENGTGVNVYVLDSGIRATHREFGGRAVGSFDAVRDGKGTNDCHGHGTHVAGTIGGASYGVAKNVRLYAVRVLNCDNLTNTDITLAGIDWVKANRVKPAVANMSLGFFQTQTSIDQAVRNLISSGVVVVLSAGNSTANACDKTPARVSEAITVGATSNSDARAAFSNYGPCLDLFAPGVSIISASKAGDTAYTVMSGTSMAAPHVAGVAALYLQKNPGASPTAVRDAIVNSATSNKVSDAGSGSPNRLLYSLLGAPPVVYTCFDKVATIVGTMGADTLRGTSGPDVIHALDGNDTIYGNGGNDLICAGNGDDTIYIGNGAGKVLGAKGNDTIYGGPGNDQIEGGNGTDRIFGGAGADNIKGNEDNDWLEGGPGRDSLDGGTGDNTIYGNEDNDQLVSGSGKDSLYGGLGNDNMMGGEGNDYLWGGQGTDTMNGQGGADQCVADTASDVRINCESQ